MIEIKEKSKCSGCQACYNICPKNAIEMIEDEKGFKYPNVNNEKCINCGLCNKVCPIINNKNITNNPKAYACINKNEEIRMESTSGGIFTLLATAIINKNGVVFGASFDEKFGVHHTYSETLEQIQKFRGSKYLQSDINDTYQEVKEFLKNDRYVLFTGTPCQIEGLINFLGREYEKLYLQDIICHGVPSPKVWKLYKEYREKQLDAKLDKMSFRDKNAEGWNRYHVKMDFLNNKSYDMIHNTDIYMKAFLKHLSLRESCTDCKFKKKNRLSDITLADFWGIKNIKPDMNDEKGTSLVIVNSKKGQELLDEIKDYMKYEEVDFETAIKGNPSFTKVSEPNKKSNQFFKELKDTNFEELIKRCAQEPPFIQKCIRKLKRIIKKIIIK
ncbi:MAG: 4Fe-4S dicluster domain-containing protein [Clostridia bacterium]|nr:4Fe-4S dicluster domain-containing protein [Clostridia bacterium]